MKSGVVSMARPTVESLAPALQRALAERTPKADAADGAKPAGVLIPLYVRDGAWHVLLNLRSNEVGEHKGEVAFPGGSIEPGDRDMVACALRETSEEMGIRPEDVTVLGQLDAVFTRTGYLVWPVVATIPHPYPFTPSLREVAEVIEAPLDHLLSLASLRHEARMERDGTLTRRVAYACDGHLVYGATSWILTQLLDLVRSSWDGVPPEVAE